MRTVLNGFISLLDDLEIESSVHLTRNKKTVKLLDHRIMHDDDTAKTYLMLKSPEDHDYVKVNLNNVIDFLSHKVLDSIPGEEEIDKVSFITSYFESIPKIQQTSGTTAHRNNYSEQQQQPVAAVISSPQVVAVLPPLEEEATENQDIIKQPSFSPFEDVNEIICKAIETEPREDAVTTLKKLLILPNGRKFIKMKAKSEDDAILTTIETLLKSGIGQAMIRNRAKEFFSGYKL